MYIPDAHEAIAPDLAIVGLRDDVLGQLHLVGVDDAGAQQAGLAGPAVDGVGGADVGQQAGGEDAGAHELGGQGGLLAGLLDDGLEGGGAAGDAAGDGGVEHVGAAEEVLGAAGDPEARDDAAVVLGGARAHVGDHVGALEEDAEERREEALHGHGARAGPREDEEGLAVLLGDEAERVLRYAEVHQLLKGRRESRRAAGATRRVEHGDGARVRVRDREGRRPRHLGDGLGPQVPVRLGVAGQQELVVRV